MLCLKGTAFVHFIFNTKRRFCWCPLSHFLLFLSPDTDNEKPLLGNPFNGSSMSVASAWFFWYYCERGVNMHCIVIVYIRWNKTQLQWVVFVQNSHVNIEVMIGAGQLDWCKLIGHVCGDCNFLSLALSITLSAVKLHFQLQPSISPQFYSVELLMKLP